MFNAVGRTLSATFSQRHPGGSPKKLQSADMFVPLLSAILGWLPTSENMIDQISFLQKAVSALVRQWRNLLMLKRLSTTWLTSKFLDAVTSLALGGWGGIV